MRPLHLKRRVGGLFFALIIHTAYSLHQYSKIRYNTHVTESVFTIKTPVFEGPLPLLLHLVQKRKLFINDISLAEVTDEYIAHMRSGASASIEVRASFISVASTLLLIKSKSLLPSLMLTDDEEKDIKNLELRLFLYKIIQESAVPNISSIFLSSPSFSRVIKHSREIIFSPDATVSKESLHTSILDVLRAIPPPAVKNPEVFVEKVVSLEDMISSLTDRIQRSITMSFAEFSDTKHKQTDQGKKVHVIVSFLALLELVRQGLVDASQNDRYQDISIEKSQDGV